MPGQTEILRPQTVRGAEFFSQYLSFHSIKGLFFLNMRRQQLCITRFKTPVDNIDWCQTAETLNFNSRTFLLFFGEGRWRYCTILIWALKEEKSTSWYSNQKWRTGAKRRSGEQAMSAPCWEHAGNISWFVLLTLIISLQPSYSNTAQCANTGEQITSASPCKRTEGEVFYY